MNKASGHRVSEKQLRAIVSAARQEIVDAVEAIGPCTIAEVAGLLGRRPTALYGHVARLVRVGLLIPAPAPGGAGRPATMYDVPARPVALRYELRSAHFRRLLIRCVGAMLRNAHRGFAHATTSSRPRVSGPERALWASHTKGRLTRRELRRVNALLAEILAIQRHAAARGRGREIFELTFVLAPVTSARPSQPTR